MFIFVCMGALEKAIEIIGGSHAVAKKLNLKSSMAVSQWKRRGVPARHVIKLCEMTNWQIKPHDLAPSIYPHPDDGMPEEMR